MQLTEFIFGLKNVIQGTDNKTSQLKSFVYTDVKMT